MATMVECSEGGALAFSLASGMTEWNGTVVARGEAFVPPGNDLNAYFTVNPSGVYRAQREALWKSIR